MNSHVVECLDDTYDRLQWAGEEYILEELEEEVAGVLKKTAICSPEKLCIGSDMYTVIGIIIRAKVVEKYIKSRMQEQCKSAGSDFIRWMWKWRLIT